MDQAQLENLTLGSVMDYPVKWPGAELATYPEKGYGLCDDEMWANRQGAEGWRSYKALLPLTVVAATSVGFAAGATLDFFGTKGQGESGATGYPLTYVLTGSETDADREGGMVLDEDEQFFIFALGFSVGKPVILDATAPTAPIYVEPGTQWLTAYDRKIQAQASEFFGITLRWPDTKCEYDLSLMKDWNVHNDVTGGEIPTTTNRVGFAGINGLRRPIIGGYRTSRDLITVRAKAGIGASWTNDVAFPIPALDANTTLVVPIIAKVYGVQQKKDRCRVCVGGSLADLDKMIDAKINERTRQLRAK